MGNSLVKTRENSETANTMTFSKFMSQPAIQKKISDVVQGKDGQRFITSIVSTVSTNPKIAECENFSIFSAALLGESLKLSPSPQLGHYYLVPYKNKGVAQAQFQLGYKGYIQLAIRSGQYKRINVLPIKEVEFIEWDKFEEKILVNKKLTTAEIENSKTVGYYAEIELVNGFRKAIYWSQEKMLAHADRYSKAFSIKDKELLDAGKIDEKDLWKYSSFWYKDFEEMGCKTMIRQLISKWGVMSIDLQTAYIKDMQAENIIENTSPVDINMPNFEDNISDFDEPVIEEVAPETTTETKKSKKQSLLDGVE